MISINCALRKVRNFAGVTDEFIVTENRGANRTADSIGRWFKVGHVVFGMVYQTITRFGLSLGGGHAVKTRQMKQRIAFIDERQTGLADDDARINPNGGAIAIGHPLGMSGTRIIMAAARELQRKNLRYALITMCIGVGQGYAVVIEKTN